MVGVKKDVNHPLHSVERSYLGEKTSKSTNIYQRIRLYVVSLLNTGWACRRPE